MKSILKLLVVVILSFSLPVHALTDRIYKDIETFSKILDIVDKQYVTTVEEDKLIEGAINGMLGTLDPHTVYFSPQVYKDFKSDTKGRFGGIGIEVAVKDGILTVIAPIQDSPADRAGIKSGDKILSIDGKSTKSMSLLDAVHLMRGPIGKKVQLGIWPDGKGRPVKVQLARELIKVESVKVEDLGEGIGYFRITTFQEDTSKSLKRAIKRFEDDNGALKGMVLDMRDNPGGLLSEAIAVSDLFLKDGTIVSTKGRDKVMEVSRAKDSGTFPDFPMAVLINGGTASAAEIVAGALQDQGRAKLLGTTSFGKGSVQTVLNLEDGAALKFTIAHYYTPKNRMIDGKGIAPDVVLDEKLFRKKTGNKRALDTAAAITNITEPTTEPANEPTEGKAIRPDDKRSLLQQFRDYQKNEALHYLKKQ